MGGRHPWKVRRTYYYKLSTFLGVGCSTRGVQTPWEGGVYKLMMIFPEGTASPYRPCTCVSTRAEYIFRLSIEASKVYVGILRHAERLTHFLQANSPHHYSTPTYTLRAPSACPFSTRRNPGNRRLQSNRSAGALADMRSFTHLSDRYCLVSRNSSTTPT